jgi:hypothetical protein
MALAGCGEATKTVATTHAKSAAKPTTKPTAEKTGCREVPDASGTGMVEVCTGPTVTTTVARTPTAAKTTPQTERPTPRPTSEPESPEERESRLHSAREALAHASTPAEASALHHEISKLVERR